MVCFAEGGLGRGKEETMRDNKRDKIVSVAADLINRKGYRGTSFQEIADRVGIHKSTLFHYFKNKEQLLLRVLEKSVDEVNSDLTSITNNRRLKAEEKLKQAFDNHLTSMTRKHPNSVNAYLYELKNLSNKNQKIYLTKRKRYEQDFERIIVEMKRQGYFNKLDSKIVTFGLLGMLNWVAKRYKDDGRLNIEQISDIFYKMIKRSDAAKG